MNNYESLSHTRWECKYHIVFIPKYRRKSLYGDLRKHLGEMFHELARQRESKIEEGHLMLDHVHMLISMTKTITASDFTEVIKKESSKWIKTTGQFDHYLLARWLR